MRYRVGVIAVTAEPLADLHAEKCTLGALMLGADDAIEVMAGLSRRDFHRGAHGDVLDACHRAMQTTGRIDPMVVTDQLDKHGCQLDASELLDMTAAVPSTANLSTYAARVRALARRRRVRDGMARASRDAADVTTDLDTTLHTAVDRLVADRDTSGLIRPSDVADDVLELHERGRDSTSIPTGWRPLDNIWRLAPGMLTILAGHPGHGKSALVDALAVTLAQTQGWRTCVFGPESSPVDDHAARMVQAWRGVRFDRLSEGQVVQALHDLDEHLVWVDHDVHTSVGGILAQASAAHARKPLQLLLIDPWSEVEAVPERGQREDMLIGAELTRIRRWGRRHGVHVVVAVHPKQVDRHQDGTLPVPHSQILHGGAVWRRKADSLLAVWRDDSGQKRKEQIVDVHVQKVRRNGIDGKMGHAARLMHDPETGRYGPVVEAAS